MILLKSGKPNEAYKVFGDDSYDICTQNARRHCNMAAVASVQISEVPVPDVPKKQVDIKTEEKASDETSLPFDPAALKEKYLAERDKRLARNQGVEQYTLLDGQLSHYLKDPWVEPGFERDPIHEETEVVIVGGGYGAQVVAVRLLEAGVDNFRIIEKAGGFGGTWYRTCVATCTMCADVNG